MSKHTAGPWILKHISGQNFAVQRFEIRSGASMPHPIFNKDTSAIDGTSVCMSPEDARLIAAAPELLEALKAARDLWGDYLPAGNSNAMKAMKLVNAAIAKATGESK